MQGKRTSKACHGQLTLCVFASSQEILNLAMVVVSGNCNDTAEALVGEDIFELHGLESKKSLCFKVSVAFVVIVCYRLA